MTRTLLAGSGTWCGDIRRGFANVPNRFGDAIDTFADSPG